MSNEDKLRNKVEEMAGRAKAGVGRATDDERLEAEGNVDRRDAHLKQAGENVKDAFRR